MKSVKDSRFPKSFESSLSDDELDEYLQTFIHYRGSHFTGGFCFKEFFDLKRYGQTTNEYRIFYLNNKVLSVSKNSGQSTLCPLPPESLINKYKELDSPYYTIDMVELSDGDWKIIETGDGQVSGLSDSQKYEVYFRDLKELLEP